LPPDRGLEGEQASDEHGDDRDRGEQLLPEQSWESCTGSVHDDLP
jgi:hypothetical protein